MTPGSTARTPGEGDADAVHIAGAVAVSAAGGELELLSTHDRGIVLRVGVEATGSPPATLRYLSLVNNAAVSLAAVQHADGLEQQLSLAPGATKITLGSVQDADCAVQVQIGPIPQEAFATAGAQAAGVVSLFVSAEPVTGASAAVSFLGQAIGPRGT